MLALDEPAGRERVAGGMAASAIVSQRLEGEAGGKSSAPVDAASAFVLLLFKFLLLLLLPWRNEKPRERPRLLEERKVWTRLKEELLRFITWTVAAPFFPPPPPEPSESSSPLPGPSLSESENAWTEPPPPQSGIGSVVQWV